jgi:hypothetical protein
MFGNLSWLEAAWIVAGLIAFTFNYINYRGAADALRNIRAQKRNGAFLLQARKNRRNELEKAVLQLGLLAIGIISAFIPEPHNAETSVGRFVSGLILLAFQVGIMASSYFDTHDNARLDKYLKASNLHIDDVRNKWMTQENRADEEQAEADVRAQTPQGGIEA